MADLPIVITAAGLQPQTPASLQAQELQLVRQTNPGYTANLPGILIEDISSTVVAALVLTDQARVETVNSLTPLGANDFLLLELGEQSGVPLGLGSNTSVFVVFTGTPGLVIGKGFTVSDGSFQYVVQDGGIIGADRNTLQLFALATQSGSWAVPAGTVTQMVTPPPTGFELSVVNPQPGVPGNSSETAASYRQRVLQAQLAGSVGMSRYLKTLLGNVPGVQSRLISAQAQEGGGWAILAGGGDNFQIAYAIDQSLFDISSLVGSVTHVTGVTQALPAVMSTDLWPAFTLNETIAIANANPSSYNGSYTVAPVAGEPTQFKLQKPYLANVFTALSWSGGNATATTTTPHGITVGSTIIVSGCTPAAYNGTFVAAAGTTASTLIWAIVSNPGVATVLGQVNAGQSLFDSTGLAAYVGSGTVTPNDRTIKTTVIDYPDTYVIPYINPPQQTVAIVVTWNTSSVNFVSAAAVAQLGTPAIVDYINSISVGQPINLFQLQDAFKVAIASVLLPELLTRMVFTVSIDGFGVDEEAGTGIIMGDLQSFLFCTAANISVVQG